jgi:hypothetical protein
MKKELVLKTFLGGWRNIKRVSLYIEIFLKV